jgi:SAM-dependent methyltransferase
MPRTLTYPWWTPWPGIGPAADVLGDIGGLRVVELGCGSGHNAAAFAAAGAVVTGVDTDRAKIAQAVERWGSRPGLGFVHANAATYLTQRHEPPDVAVSIFGALSFSPASPLLDLIRARLAPHGRLALSVRLPPAGSHSPDEWTALLETHGFEIDRCLVLSQPDEPQAPGCTVLVAREPARTPAPDDPTYR